MAGRQEPGSPSRQRRLSAPARLVEAIAQRPDSAMYRNNLGNALRALGQADEAEAAYREALRLDPSHVRAAGNLGALLRGLGRIDEAIACQRRVAALRPQRADLSPGEEARADLEATMTLAPHLATEAVSWAGSLG